MIARNQRYQEYRSRFIYFFRRGVKVGVVGWAVGSLSTTLRKIVAFLNAPGSGVSAPGSRVFS